MGHEITSDKIAIPVGDKGSTSGILTRPAAATESRAVIVAHGAGNDMTTALLVAFAEGIAKAGYPVLRFNFLYSEHGRKTPDRPEALMDAWLAACRSFKEIMGSKATSITAAGKSLGGRMAAIMAADGILPADSLIFLGYPLHPMDNKEKLRDAHLYRVKIPMLFFEGTRDPLCDLGKLDPVLKSLQTSWDLFTIEGGDHSFHVPKSLGLTEEEVFGRIVKKTIDWLKRHAGR
ncbi:MAG: dienelactone hydrolase family protein [Syntrophobacterales bacterium]|nr:dienelactone hydrolase family protein [Syntrophobacterales bacterium]